MNNLKIIPVNTNSKFILERAEFALLGVSPFNSYFSVEKIVELIDIILNNFVDFAIFIPDQISSFTLEALGYEKTKIKYKIRKQDNYLKNKVCKALDIITKKTAIDISNKVINLSDLLNNTAYTSCYNKIIELFNNDQMFRQGCLDTSKWIIVNHNTYKNSAFLEITDDSLMIAVQYFLKELPIFLCSPEILSVHSCCFIYPNIPAFLTKIYSNYKLSLANQGFVIVKQNNA